MEKLELEFLKELDIRNDIAKQELKYNATRFSQMLNGMGAVDTAKKLISSGMSDGFTKLYMAGRLDLSTEAVVVMPKYKSLFTKEEVEICKKRLSECGYRFE